MKAGDIYTGKRGTRIVFKMAGTNRYGLSPITLGKSMTRAQAQKTLRDLEMDKIGEIPT